MNKCPPKPEGSGAGGPDRSRRGQSEVLALTVLIGMIFVGAAAVLITGGYLVDGVQQDSKHQLAQDSADQTHQRIFEAASSGDSRQLPDGEVVDSGSVTLAMTNDTRECRSVSEDLGAIEFDAGDRKVIYEGGAIWENSESGYSIRRAPGINYSDGRSQISLTVIEGASRNDDGELVVEPDESQSKQLNRDISDMILDCRLAGNDYRDLNVSVESHHADAWEQYFEQSVTGENVTVSRPSEERVNVSIDDISEPIDYEEWLVIHEWERNTEDARIEKGNEWLNVSARIRNTGPIATSGEVTLDIENGPESSPASVNDLGRGELQWVDLQVSPAKLSSLTAGDVYDYDVNVTPSTGEDWTFEDENSSVSHSFYYGEPSDVFEVMDVGHTTNETTVEVEGLIGNIGTEQGVQDVELSLRHVPSGEEVGTNVPPVETNLSANATGTVSWTLNRSTIAGGTYEYTISSDDDSETGTFDVSSFEGGDSRVETGTVGTGTITVLGTEVSAESLLSVDVPDSEKEDATLERVDRGMFMPTLVAEESYHNGGEPVEKPGGGWVPAERVNGDLEPIGTSPDCAGRPTDYETDTSETYDDWDGWEVDDCWDDPDGFVWSDSSGYELEWAIAGQTVEGGFFGSVVDREDTTWTFGGDGELQYEKNWAPVSAEVIVEKNGEQDHYHEWEPGSADEHKNLNTYNTQEQEWTQEIYLESDSRVTVASTLWGCSGYEDMGTRPGDLDNQWRDYNCHSPKGVSNSVDASGDNDDPGVRVLTDEDEVPVLRGGFPDQRNATEVLNDGAAHRINESTGELELNNSEAVFLIELTETTDDVPGDMWDAAKTQESYGDPNYNDVIVLFEYDAVVQEVIVDSTSSPDDNDGFDPGVAGGGDTSSETGGEGSNIETDVTHVVIG